MKRDEIRAVTFQVGRGSVARFRSALCRVVRIPDRFYALRVMARRPHPTLEDGLLLHRS
jgi:hypothetical protein